jgi:YHS domain-containing protein
MFPVLALAAFAVLASLSGCKEEPAAQQVQQTNDQHAHALHEQVPADQPAVQTASMEQETCPIMEGNPINKNLFVEYEGKKVYFCCAGCPDKFMANPEQYVAKLPQFQK